MGNRDQTAVVGSGMLLGIGLGGFIDGIVFHQLLQVHSMLSAKVPRDTLEGIQTNMFWDGVFHVATWAATVAGVALLWRTAQREGPNVSTSTFLGGLAVGWGLFNLVEGILNHHVLHLHHVVETANHQMFDVAFLVVGALMVVAGIALIRREPR